MNLAPEDQGSLMQPAGSIVGSGAPGVGNLLETFQEKGLWDSTFWDLSGNLLGEGRLANENQ